MGRETKILLGLLATLASVFVALLVGKLFIARPPAGAGVDVHADVAVVESNDLVEPPRLGRPGQSAFSAVAATDAPEVDSQVTDSAPGSLSESGAPQPGARVSRFSSSTPGFSADAPPSSTVAEAPQPEPSNEKVDAVPAAPPEPAPASARGVVPVTLEVPLPPSSRPRAIEAGSACTVEAGDSWWSLAAAAYGDGRHHRGLYAWNRAIDPRVTLAPGTRVVVPGLDELAAAHPDLMPPAEPVSPSRPGGVAGIGEADTVVVREGDTLLSIARERLGSPARWRELYAWNREVIDRARGELRPGTTLVLKTAMGTATAAPGTAGLMAPGGGVSGFPPTGRGTSGFGDR